MRRATRIAIYALAGFAAGLVVAVLAVLILARTDFGQEKVRVIVQNKLSKKIEGQLSIKRVSSRGLLTGATIHEFEIKDKKGQRFVWADSARVSYKWRTLLRGDIQFDNVRVYGPRVVIEQLPGDSIWNYESIFVDKSPGVSGQRNLIEFTNAEILDGFLTVRRPYNPANPAEVKDSRNIIEQVPGGYVKVMRFDSVNARLSRVLWESPIEEGRLFDAQKVAAVAYVWKEPLRVRHLEGRVSTVDSLISFDLKPVQFGGSKADVLGRVIMEEGRNVVDVKIVGDPLEFKDLLWLYPKLPEKGNANLTLRIQSQPNGMLWYATNARIVAPGTNLKGNFGVVTGDSMYFTDVDLTANPINLELLEKVLGDKLPVQGLMVGTLEVKGPISNLDIKGDVRLTSPHSDASSTLKWQGNFDARGEWAATNLKGDVENLDLAVLNALRPELKLPKGIVKGSFEADGVLKNDLRFAADLQHELAGMSSRFEGSGSYSGGGKHLDLKLNALPLSFEDLASAYPALKKLRGEARGPITIRGPIDNLDVTAKLATRGGELDFTGKLQESGGRRRYSGEGRMSGFQLDRLLYDLPGMNVSGKIHFDLTGTSAADANGTVAVQLDSAQVTGVQLSDVRVESRVQNGLLAVDTAQANSFLGRLAARGDFGIASGKNGRLDFTAYTDSIVPLGESTRVTGGRLMGNGSITGGIESFDISAISTIERALYARAHAKRVTVRLDGRALGSDSGSVQLNLNADSADFYGERLDSVRLELLQRSGSGQLNVNAGSSDRSYRMTGDLHTDTTGAVRLAVREAAGGLRENPWLLQAPFDLRVGATGLQADTFAFRQTTGEGNASGGGRLAWARSRGDSLEAAQRPLDFRLALRNVPLNEYVRFFRTNATTDGSIEAQIAVGGTAVQPTIRADATFTDLRYGDARLERLTSTLAYSGQRMDVRVQGMQNGHERLLGEGRIPLDLGFVPVRERKLNQPLEFSLRADSLPASVATGLVHGFNDVRGVIAGTLDLRGTTRDPTIAGLLTLTNGSATYEATGVRYRGVEGTFKVLNDTVVAIDASLRAGDGDASLTGTMLFAPLGNPEFDLTFKATNFLAASRREGEFTTSGELLLNGNFRQPLIKRGEITIERGTLRIDELYRQTQMVQLDPSRLFSVVDTSLVSFKRVLPVSTSPFIKNLKIENLALNVGRESWLRSRALNVEVEGRLLVALERDLDEARSVQDIRLAGELTAVRGTYQMEYNRFTVRRFVIREGTVEFPGTPGIDPNLTFTTVYRVQPVREDPFDILAMVSGTLLSPRIRLASDQDPPRSESDLASYLFLGVPTGLLSPAQSRSLDAFNGELGGAGAVAGLGINYFTNSGLGFLAGGLQSLFQDYNLFDYVSLTATGAPQDNATAPSAMGFSSFLNNIGNARLEVGRYVPPFYVILTRPLASTSAELGARVEWRFLNNYTAEVMLAEDRFSRGAPVGIENSAAFRKVYGFSLFREWSY